MNMLEKISDISKQHGVADLYVFGSRGAEIVARVHGQSTKSPPLSNSDVDFGVTPIDFSNFGPLQRVSLSIELENLLDAPKVDLVVLPEVDPFLALEIIRGELLYTNDPERQARHELYILRRAGDLMPFKKERIRMILEEEAR